MIREVFQYITLLSVALCLLAPQVSIGQDAENLVALWLFDEGKGDTIKDSSGNGHDGTIEGAKWDDGKFDGGLTFANNKVTVPYKDDLYLEEEFTIEVWVKAQPTGGYQAIVARGKEPRNYYLGIESNSGDIPLCNLTSGGGWGGVRGTTSLTDGEWHHVAVTYEDGVGRMYVDGDMETESALPNPPDKDTVPMEVTIGWNVSEFLNGTVDDIALWRVVLDEDEIQKTMEEGLQSLIAPVSPGGKLATAWGGIKGEH